MSTRGNIFAALPAGKLSQELVNELLATPNLRIERIISTGQASPPDFWYEQDWNEWVILLSGAAQLIFENEPEPRSLVPGDYVHVMAHTRHRVVWTDPHRVTVWLAIHFR